ncbi:MAG: (d)CMP kinase [Microthrixaceae bacterium]
MRVIAIDGPAGSGKSTVGRKLADRLGLTYLDTGAMYRAVAFAAIRQGVDPDEADKVAALGRAIDIVVDEGVVRVDDIDATLEIRGPEVTRAVSMVAANPAVREELRARQRAWAIERGGGVIEGRDIGTVVFPEALLKVYLTASVEVRARRRAKEMTDLDYDEVAADIARRDAADSSRTDSPLATAADAVTVDTSEMGIDAAVEALVEMVHEREAAVDDRARDPR